MTGDIIAPDHIILALSQTTFFRPPETEIPAQRTVISLSGNDGLIFGAREPEPPVGSGLLTRRPTLLLPIPLGRNC